VYNNSVESEVVFLYNVVYKKFVLRKKEKPAGEHFLLDEFRYIPGDISILPLLHVTLGSEPPKHVITQDLSCLKRRGELR
jgi:hypothetical protein